MDQWSVIAGLCQEPVPAPESRSHEEATEDLWTIDEGEKLHRQPRDDRESDPGCTAPRGHRHQHGQRSETQGRRQHRNPRQCDADQRLAGRNQQAGQIDDRLSPDDERPAATLLTARADTASNEKTSAVSTFPANTSTRLRERVSTVFHVP